VIVGMSRGFEFARGGEGVGRWGYVFSSLMKQKIKGKKYAVFYFTGKRIFFFNICDVITWGKRKKSPANHYW
jgi:hypothetical protein